MCFVKSYFFIPSFEKKKNKIIGKRVCTMLNCSFLSRACAGRSVEKSRFTIDRSVDRSIGQGHNDVRNEKSNMASFSHDKHKKRSQLSPSIYPFSCLIFHKLLTYDRNQIKPDRALLLKSCCIQLSARTAAGKASDRAR